MAGIKQASLLTLEAYARARGEWRARVIQHKENRRVHLGEHVTLVFEDELTVRYQIQEMLRAERIFEDAAIAAEIEAYSPLVPDGGNWKATMLIEYPDPVERRAMLAKLVGIERCVWVEAESVARIYAASIDDPPVDRPAKTASVHFLRFDLEHQTIAAIRGGAALSIGVDHPEYSRRVEAGPAIAAALSADLTA